MIIVSSRYCQKCDKHFKLKELVRKETLPMMIEKEFSKTTASRIYLACPICGEEIPNVIVPEEEAGKYDD